MTSISPTLRLLTPWAPDRASQYSRILVRNLLPEYASPAIDENEMRSIFEYGRLRMLGIIPDPTLAEYAQYEGTFAKHVAPVIDQITLETDMAPLLIGLLQQIADAPTHERVIQLYQLVFNHSRYNSKVWPTLSEQFQATGLNAHDMVFELLLWWAFEAPDTDAVIFALILLTVTVRQPPLDVLMTLGRSHTYALIRKASDAIAAHYAPAEEPLIALARFHTEHSRTAVLSSLVRVDSPDNRQWLLTEGYDNHLPNEPSSVYFAAVHGRLIEVLRKHSLTAEELHHVGRMFELMCGLDVIPRAPMYYYHDGPEAAQRLIDHATAAGTPESLWPALSSLLWFLEENDANSDCEKIWPESVCKQLAHRLRELLTQPHVAPGLLWWDRAAPTLDDLKAGDLSELNSVLNSADTENAMSDIVDWIIEHLALDGTAEAQAERKAALLVQPMEGVRTGGMASAMDEQLGSQYGQLVLQTLQKVQDGGITPNIWPLVEAALDSDVLFHRQTAAEVLAKWPAASLPAGAMAAAQRALAAAGDDDAVSVALSRFMI